MARVEALPQRLGQSHHVDVPHAGRKRPVRTVKHRFACCDLHADVRIGATLKPETKKNLQAVNAQL